MWRSYGAIKQIRRPRAINIVLLRSSVKPLRGSRLTKIADDDSDNRQKTGGEMPTSLVTRGASTVPSPLAAPQRRAGS